MSQKLYVGNLPHGTNEEQIRALFSQAGEVVRVSLVVDRQTGLPKAFGFVTMGTQQGSQEAIRLFQGYNLGDHAMMVNEAPPPRDQFIVKQRRHL